MIRGLLEELSCLTMVLCVLCVVIPFILDVRLVDVPAGVTREEGHTGPLHLPTTIGFILTTVGIEIRLDFGRALRRYSLYLGSHPPFDLKVSPPKPTETCSSRHWAYAAGFVDFVFKIVLLTRASAVGNDLFCAAHTRARKRI